MYNLIFNSMCVILFKTSSITVIEAAMWLK